MRRLIPRTPLSEDPREFVLASILFTVAAVLFAGFGVTTLRGDVYSASDWSGVNLAWQVLGWGKWVAFLRLIWLGSHAALAHRYIGPRRALMLWLPLVLFACYAWLQRGMLEGARIDYLQRTGQGAAEHGGLPLWLVAEIVAAFVLTAANALRVRGRGLRLAQ
jgi:hypothetical protein